MKNDYHTIYAFSHCETWLEDYAKSNKLPFNELAEGVANLFQLQTGRQISGLENNMSALRRNSASRNSTTRKMAMDERTHRKAQRPVSCKLCKKVFKSRSDMMRHKFSNHTVLMKRQMNNAYKAHALKRKNNQ